MKINCTFFLLFSFVFLNSIQLTAQMHERKGGNLGATFSGGLNYSSAKALESSLKPSFLYSAGITRSFADLVFPEINYTFSKANYGIEDSSSLSLSNQNHSLGLGLNSKVTIFQLSTGKSSKGECTVLNFKLLLGLHYTYHFKNTANFSMTNANDFYLETGLGLLPRWSGGHKSRVAWNYYFDVVYRFDMNKNSGITVNSVSDFKNNALLLRLTIIKYHTVDFLGGNQKKKSYNKKY